jgi:hypothetical protein
MIDTKGWESERGHQTPQRRPLTNSEKRLHCAATKGRRAVYRVNRIRPVSVDRAAETAYRLVLALLRGPQWSRPVQHHCTEGWLHGFGKTGECS